MIAENTGGAAPSKQEPVIAKKSSKAREDPASKPKVDLDPHCPYCKDLPSEFGPYVGGVDPECDWHRDGDKDGVVCESR